MTLSEALAEADREWEERVIQNGKEMNWNGHKLRFELSPSDCVGCFFKDKSECPDCDDGAWVEDSPWCTGKPTEEGWYLLAFKYGDEDSRTFYEVLKWEGVWKDKDIGWDALKVFDLAWMPITPYEEKENGHTD